MRSAHVLLQGGDPHQVQLPQAAPTSRLQSLQLHTSGIMSMVRAEARTFSVFRSESYRAVITRLDRCQGRRFMYETAF